MASSSPNIPAETARLAFRAGSSVRLTVVLLTLSIALVFFATLDTAALGIRGVQKEYFEKLVSVWQYPAGWPGGEALGWLRLPLPGGYLLGPLLVVNLLLAHFRYHRPSWAKGGIVLIHFGVVLLLVSQLVTQLVQKEYYVWVGEGETADYLESFTDNELVLVEHGGGGRDRVWSIPASLLREGAEFAEPSFPVAVRVERFLQNAAVAPRARFNPDAAPYLTPPATRGLGAELDLAAYPRPAEGRQDRRDVTTALVRLRGDGGEGLWLVDNASADQRAPQTFQAGGKTYEVALRIRRHYLPYTLTLRDFVHERYPGTEIPKNFASTVELHDPRTGERRETVIFMNNPLRYDGLAFFQASFERGDTRSMFQVVDNPGWWGAYFACGLMTAGLLWQFGWGLWKFAAKRRTPAPAHAAPTAPAAPAPRRPFPWLATVGGAVAAVALAAVPGRMTPPEAAFTDLTAFAKVPVQSDGRVKPVEAEARNLLMLLGERAFAEVPDGVTGGLLRRMPPVEFAATALFDPDRAAGLLLFRVDHKELAGLLGQADEKRKHFSFREIADHLEALQARAAQVPQEAPLRTPYDRAVLRLQQGVSAYLEFSFALRAPPGRPGAPLEGETSLAKLVAAYEAQLPAGRAAFRAQQAGEAHEQDDLMAFFLWVDRFKTMGEWGGEGLIPPLPGHGEAGEEWASLGESLASAAGGAPVDSLARAWIDAAEAWRAQDATAFDAAVARLADGAERRLPGTSAEMSSEKTYLRLAPFAGATGLYLLVFLGACTSWLGWSRPLRTAAVTILALAVLWHGYGIVARMLLQDHPPVTNLYSSAVFIGWVAALAALAYELLYRNGLGGAAAGLIGVGTLLVSQGLSLSAGGDTIEVMRAVLNSQFWLGTHVTTVTAGYAATFLAGTFGLFRLVRGLFPGGLDKATAAALDRMIYGTVCFALLFSFVGTVLGGIWADQSWGRFWGWDPKENGALMIVLWNAVVLHARWGKLVTPRGLAALAILGNIITAWSWFGTNMLGVGLHAYGFMDEAFFWHNAFAVSQLLVAALVFFPERRLPPPATPPAAPPEAPAATAA